MSKNTSKYIKDHVSTHGKDIKKATVEKFDINNALIIQAVNGDEKALTKIGDMGNLGERLVMAMPAIRENLKSYIRGTTEYNKSLAEIYKEGGKGAIAISQAGMGVKLENTKYNNLMEEYLAQFTFGEIRENQRHDDKMDVIELQAWVDSMMTTVDAKANLESITSKPFEAQIKADKDYETKKMQHLLQHGSEGDLELIPQKHYSGNWATKAWNSIVDIFN
jgi:hypothetical protein